MGYMGLMCDSSSINIHSKMSGGLEKMSDGLEDVWRAEKNVWGVKKCLVG